MTSIKELLQSASLGDRQTLNVDLGERSYEIRIAEGLIDGLADEAGPLMTSGAPAVVITCDALEEAHHYGGRAKAGLEAAGIETYLCTVPDTEKAKSWSVLGNVLDFLVDKRLPRQSTLFAVGGGVIGDMGGFAAAIYLRGIDYVQVPTTLLSMVDSSVGGKTAVNHPKGKNLIGAFYQPRLVLADLSALATLPKKHYLSGMGEVIKHGVIRDAELFEAIEQNMDSILAREANVLAPIIRRNCEIKAAVVKTDEKEHGLRAILNFGHTLGHAIENLCAAAGMGHGEAVAIGMVGASLIAVKMDMWTEEEHNRLRALIEQAGLPVTIPPLNTEDILDRMLHDKKIVGKTLRFVLPEALGQVTIRSDVPAELLKEAIEELKP